MQNTVLHTLALFYFQEKIMNKNQSKKETLKCLEDHCLDNRVKRANTEVWKDATFHLVKAKRTSRNDNITHEKVSNELCTQIWEQVDIETGSCHLPNVMGHTIVVVRVVGAFALVYWNPPRKFQERNVALGHVQWKQRAHLWN